MYGVFLLLLGLGLRADGYIYWSGVTCEYLFSTNYPPNASYYNVPESESTVSDYCTTKDVPKYTNFTVIQHADDMTKFSLRIKFAILPKKECRFGIALVVDPSVRDEEECENYEFINNVNSKIHTTEDDLCFLRNANEFVKYDTLKTVVLWFHNIFTGCYAIRFHLGKRKYVTTGHVVIKTSYLPPKIAEPQFTCKYETVTDQSCRDRTVTNFALDTSLPVDIGIGLLVGFVPMSPNKICYWESNDGLGIERTVSLLTNENETKINNFDVLFPRDKSCSLKEERTANGEHIKTLQCNFQVQTTHESTGYCSVFEVYDSRCWVSAAYWNNSNPTVPPCWWIKRCVNSTENASHVESARMIEHSSSFLSAVPIIAVAMIVLTIVGTVWFFRCVRARKDEVNLYVNPHPDDFLNPACLKPTEFGIANSIVKGIDNHDDPVSDDIVLLYTRGTQFLMTLMKDLREILARTCSCNVHDWHDGAEWNDVAKVGAVVWFTKLFDSGCRVVWIDTPASRSVFASNATTGKSAASANNKFGQCHHGIGDFRDVAFPVVLDLAKRNTRSTQYRRHFVVRFEGTESALATTHDPFLDLSPHTRYLMPQCLTQLCTDL